ncbi:MAG: hypothetical protein ACE15B_08825 [Bryobacteraceae bacterium]
MSFLLEGKLGAYVEAVHAAGLEAEPVSPKRRRGLEGLGGLVPSGGGDVKAAALALDGVMEALEDPSRRFVAAVQ